MDHSTALPEMPTDPLVLTAADLEQMEALCAGQSQWAAWLAAPSPATLIEIPSPEGASTYTWFDGRPIGASEFQVLRPLLWICLRARRRCEDRAPRPEIWWSRRPEAQETLRALRRAQALAHRLSIEDGSRRRRC